MRPSASNIHRDDGKGNLPSKVEDERAPEMLFLNYSSVITMCTMKGRDIRRHDLLIVSTDHPFLYIQR